MPSIRPFPVLVSTSTAIATIVVLSSCAQQARFKHAADARATHVASSPIEVRTENGSITISRAAVAEVQVHADIRAVTQARADATMVTTERGPDGTLLISVKWPDGKRQSNEACSLEIRVPDAAGVRLFTSNGDIDAKGLAGAAKMETSNGDVVVTDHAGSLEADSSNGSITLVGVTGAVDLDTGNGDISVRGATGAIEADTSNGDVTIVLGAGDAGPLDVETSNGSIELTVGPGFAGVVEAGTSHGSVDVNGGSVQIARRGKSHATLTFGGGGAKSTLSTSNGSVKVAAAK